MTHARFFHVVQNFDTADINHESSYFWIKKLYTQFTSGKVTCSPFSFQTSQPVTSLNLSQCVPLSRCSCCIENDHLKSKAKLCTIGICSIDFGWQYLHLLCNCIPRWWLGGF